MSLWTHLLTYQWRLALVSIAEVPCEVFAKAPVLEEDRETAEVTSHDFWHGKGKRNGVASPSGLEGRTTHTTIRRRAGWSEKKRE